jgi:acid phosphatase type 7
MKIQKINGKYRQQKFGLKSRVPFLVWAILTVFGVFGVGFVLMQTWFVSRQPSLTNGPVREHSFTVVAVGDIACEPDNANFNNGDGIVDACRQKSVAEAVKSERADAVILLGDIQYLTGTAGDYDRSFVPYWRGIQDPMYVVAGNHDYGNGERSPATLTDYKRAFRTYFPRATYEQVDGRSYYDFSLGQWQLYALDSNCEYIGGCGTESPQYSWLVDQVSMDKAQCSIGMWHHPVLTSGQHKEKDSVVRGQTFNDYLTSQDADIILNGHDHDYERIKPDVLAPRQFVVGTGGYSLRPTTEPYATGSEKRIDNSFGYLRLTLYPGRYKWEFKNVAGEVLDSGADTCK